MVNINSDLTGAEQRRAEKMNKQYLAEAGLDETQKQMIVDRMNELGLASPKKLVQIVFDVGFESLPKEIVLEAVGARRAPSRGLSTESGSSSPIRVG